jgi:hypothetical protein
VEKGNTYHNSALCAGVCERSYYTWIEKAEKSKQENIYTQFLQALKKAKAEAEKRNVTIIQAASIETWQAAAWWLERRNPSEYGRKERVEHELFGKEGAPPITYSLEAENAALIKVLQTPELLKQAKKLLNESDTKESD